MAASPNVIQIPQIQEIFACGIQTPGKFCLLNPESWPLESGISLNESRIPLMIGIGNQSSTDKDPAPGICNPWCGIQNPRMSWIPWIPLHVASYLSLVNVWLIVCTILLFQSQLLHAKMFLNVMYNHLTGNYM